MPNEVKRCVYVISDLHLGGQSPTTDDPTDRGFRIFTHTSRLAAFITAIAQLPSDGPRVELVINGDFVDFLAEADPAPGKWSPLKTSERAAVLLQTIATREAPIFSALSQLLHNRHGLTIILGNHDIELSFPDVRRCLARILKLDGQRGLNFVYDGEAYVIGDVIIEHGNAYDSFNINAYDAVRQIRAWQSRREPVPDGCWQPSAGSRLVATVMNPLKARYPFIDLLKPEGEAAIPLLIALDPSCVRYIPQLIPVIGQAGKQQIGLGHVTRGAFDTAVCRSFAGFGDGIPSLSSIATADPLEDLLNRQLGPAGAAAFNHVLAVSSTSDGVACSRGFDITGTLGGVFEYAAGLAEMLLNGDSKSIQARLSALLMALRAFQHPCSFDRASEPDGPYRRAAEGLGKRGYKAIVFGHTHFARRALVGDAIYLNTGTWADIIRFPEDIVSGPEEAALAKLTSFVESIKARDYARWLYFAPTYARLDFAADDTLLDATLHEFVEKQVP